MATDAQKQEILGRYADVSAKRDAAKRKAGDAATAAQEAKAEERDALAAMAHIAVEAKRAGVTIPRRRRAQAADAPANGNGAPITTHPDDEDDAAAEE
jgi:hypothetical protein